MERGLKTLNNLSDLMEKDNRGVQITCYSIALFGLTVALRRVRPFSKFRKPSDVPTHFIKERKEILGCVKRIDPNGALLMVEHKPLLYSPFRFSGELPVKVSGVSISSLGTNWLQSIVTGQNVTLIPVAKEKDYIHCQVLLLQTTKDNKKNIIDIGESLVKIGFAFPETIEKPLSEDSIFLKYYALLLSAEKTALRKKLGIKYYIIPAKKMFSTFSEKLVILFSRTKQNAPKVILKVPKIYSS